MGRTGEYLPEVLTVRTKRSEVRTEKTAVRYSPEQAWLMRDLLNHWKKTFIDRRDRQKDRERTGF